MIDIGRIRELEKLLKEIHEDEELSFEESSNAAAFISDQLLIARNPEIQL